MTTSNEDVLIELMLKVNNIKDYIIAREAHQDGTPHVHVYLCLADPLRIGDPRFWDILGFHGKFEGCRSAVKVIAYVTKEKNWISNMDVAKMLAKHQKVTRREIGAALVLEKRTLPEMCDLYPEMIYQYETLKKNLILKEQDSMPPRELLPAWLPNPWQLLLASNVRGKKRHLWIFSRLPNFGKTHHFAKPLAKKYGAYLHSGGTGFRFWTVDQGVRVVVLDEYNAAGLQFHEMNSMCDGFYRFDRKGLPAIVLEDPLIIVLSNSSIQDIYPYKYPLVTERFIEHELTVLPVF